MMKPFTENVIQVIRQIPEGRVMTYGQIAKTAGSPRGARQVVRLLHSMSRKYDLPWHRVINVKGEIALKDEEAAMNQRDLLEHEGVKVDANGCIDLTKYQLHLNLWADEDG